MSLELLKHKASSLLYKEENEQLFMLLGIGCQTIATSVIELYSTEPPHHSEWIKKDTGILCFVKDNSRKNFFFRLYCLNRNTLIWEQELYCNMEYITSCEFLYTFEGQGCIIAFNFANVMEAKEFKAVVDQKLFAKRRREEKRKSRNNIPNQQQTPRLPTHNDLTMNKNSVNTVQRKTKRRQITKADIGTPSEFRHVTHVGWDLNKGFDINSDDPSLNSLFEKAGVSKKHLQDKDTRDFIYDFINKHGGREAVEENVQKTKKQAPIAPIAPSFTRAPTTPRRKAGRSHSRTAPLAPTTLKEAQQPPAPPLRNADIIPPPPPAPGIAGPPSGIAPPPPPPPPPIVMPTSTAIPNEITPPAPDMRSALMESIRGGKTLKPVDAESEPEADNSHGDLLSEIRKGFHLKPASEREVKPVTPPDEPDDDLAGALAKALADRIRAINPDGDSTCTSDTDSNEDEWNC